MSPPDDLTPRQSQVLAFIEQHVATHGFAPSVAEIARAFGLASPNGVAKHLAALEQKGWLTVAPGKARGLRLVASQGVPATPLGQWALPVLGRVAAGAPIGAAAELGESLLVDQGLFALRPDYLLRVQGESMRDDGILDGDLVAVKRASTAEDGQIVVARIDGEVTIKRLRRTGEALLLLPRNPDYAPIAVPADAEFAIEGLYCGLIRRG